MSRNSPEYRSILKATGKLTRALKNNITPICADLVANDLITTEQQKKLRNAKHDAIERAADLVQLLTDKVEENPANYHTLVRILGATYTPEMVKNAYTCSSKAISRNTPEYRSILKATGKLTRALKNNITPICADLVANDLITTEQQKKLRNATHDEAIERAADLVQLLTDRVEENPANYHTLIRILRGDRATYKDVLECLALPSDPTPSPLSETGMAAATTRRSPSNFSNRFTPYSRPATSPAPSLLHSSSQPELSLIRTTSGRYNMHLSTKGSLSHLQCCVRDLI